MAQTSSSSAATKTMNTKLRAPTPQPNASALKAADDKASEHFHQDVPGDHRHEQSQAQAERAHHEGDELDRRNQRDHDQWRAVRHEQREELQAMLPEADDQDDREAQDREHAGDAEMAGRRERVNAE